MWLSIGGLFCGPPVGGGSKDLSDQEERINADVGEKDAQLDSPDDLGKVIAIFVRTVVFSKKSVTHRSNSLSLV